ncbi:MAG TPA: tyrosine-type recombinase/integrase [Actinomycetes bacterium]|jgi:integrase|nr:tyrosine-type recombinase/integrase [Actinomycetes bacterium]
MGTIDHRPDRPKPWRARYWGSDNRQHSKSFGREKDAKAWLRTEEGAKDTGTWLDPARGRIRFEDWADRWWAVWSQGKSPSTLQAAESRLRVHLRPIFGPRRLNTISALLVERWQKQIASDHDHETVLACRSLLNRILKAAVKDRRIPFNPVRDVDPPPKPVNPERRLGNAKRRTFTPEEFGRFLANCPAFHRKHFMTQVGTGLRPGELLGLPPHRVRLDEGLIEVVEVRYDAGKFGAGYKKEPKSPTSIRAVPLPEQVRAAIEEGLDGCPRNGRVFAGPGGNRHARRGERTALSVNNYRRVYKRVVARTRGLDHLDLHGPHDLRHTYATWLEEAGIPSRVIDELMGHSGSEREGSPMARVYRHTTPEMRTRAAKVIEDRLAIALRVAQM